MIGLYIACRCTVFTVLLSFARQRRLLRDFMTDLQKITAFIWFPPYPSNGFIMPLIVQGEIVRKNNILIIIIIIIIFINCNFLCNPVAVVILHVYNILNWLLLNLSREGYMRSM